VQQTHSYMCTSIRNIHAYIHIYTQHRSLPAVGEVPECVQPGDILDHRLQERIPVPATRHIQSGKGVCMYGSGRLGDMCACIWPLERVPVPATYTRAYISTVRERERDREREVSEVKIVLHNGKHSDTWCTHWIRASRRCFREPSCGYK
jgi:hypothetical protein